MPSFEEEALARAQLLSHARTKAAQPREPKPEPKPPPKSAPANKGGVLELFFRDRERSLLMTLLLLLMDENSDPGLLLALVYMLL